MSPELKRWRPPLLTQSRTRAKCEFMSEVAGEMPSFVIADLMGLPLSDGRELYRLTEIIHTDPASLAEGASAEAIQSMFSYAMTVIQDKRAHPGNDLASQLLSAELDGRRLTDEEFLLFFMLLVDAGGDTTRNLVGTGTYELIHLNGAWDQLAHDPAGRLPLAREELLRFTSPVIYMRRTLTQDYVLGGQTMRQGDKVVMYYGAANRDPRVFTEPHRLDLTRQGERHLAFGGGASCLFGAVVCSARDRRHLHRTAIPFEEPAGFRAAPVAEFHLYLWDDPDAGWVRVTVSRAPAPLGFFVDSVVLPLQSLIAWRVVASARWSASCSSKAVRSR